MAIVVENGSIVAGANSYVSEADLTAYAASRGVTLTTIKTTEQLLIIAMDYIESLSYIGLKQTESQPLQWPRESVYIDTYYIDAATIPRELKNGLMATAIAVSDGADPLATIGRATKKEKLDVMEVEYMDNAASTAITRTINASLKKLLKDGGSSGNQL